MAEGSDEVLNVYGNTPSGTATSVFESEEDGDYKVVDSYQVIMNGGRLNRVYGGYYLSGSSVKATYNKANITGGTVNHIVCGGYAYGKNATAEYNEVNISGGTFGTAGNQGIPGGNAQGNGTDGTGTAKNNKVNISGGTFGQNFSIFGGYVYGKNATAENNEVNISGGTFASTSSTTNIYGGYVIANGGEAKAEANTVNISVETINNSVIYGAYMQGNGSFTAKDNVVNLLKSNMNLVASLYGYNSVSGQIDHSGNTLNVCGKNIRVGSVRNFDNVNFFLPDDTTDGATMLTVQGTADLTGTTLGAAAQPGLNLNVGDTVNLLTAGTLTTDAPLQTTASVTTPTSISTDTSYTFNITKSGEKTIIATVASKTDSGSGGTSDSGTSDSGSSGSSGVNGGSSNSGSPAAKTNNTLPERTKSLAETMAGSISMLNGGMDMTVGQSFDNAAAAVEAEKAEQARGTDGQQVVSVVNGFTPFATIGGSNMRAKSGSYVDTKGWGVDVGFARELHNKQGKLLFGPLVGYGRANYDSYLDSGVHGNGKTSFWSLGLVAKQVNDNGLYFEGSIRGGKVKSDYYSGNFAAGMTASYDTSASFFAAHLGVGKIFDLGHENKLDTYLKYYYTHQGGDRVAISSNIGPTQTFDFDSINSSRLRLGVRFTHALNERQEVYTGLAYQYEFDGSARATYNGQSTPSPSIKGSSGMLELGFRTKVSSNMDIDLNVNGWAGKQRGVNAQLGMNWKF